MMSSLNYDAKSGKRREMIARVSFNTAYELGFRGNLYEWERLMGGSREAVNNCRTAIAWLQKSILTPFWGRGHDRPAPSC
jgi:hypothetical protein